MGITIHYRFLRSEEPENLLRKIQPLAEEMGMNIIERSWNKMILHPHPKCEAISLHWHKVKTIKKRTGWDYDKSTLNDECPDAYEEDWYCSSFTKTQYASKDIHVKVAEFLRVVASFCRMSVVSDEAEYYESQDFLKASESIDQNQKLIDDVFTMLKKAGFKEGQIIKGSDL